MMDKKIKIIAISYKTQLDCILCTAESDKVSSHMLYVIV